MIRTQIYLKPIQLRFLKAVAQEEEITVSEVLRRMIEEKQKEKKQQRKNIGKWLLYLAKTAVKKKFAGPKDLAKNIDFYLYYEKKH